MSNVTAETRRGEGKGEKPDLVAGTKLRFVVVLLRLSVKWIIKLLNRT